MVGKKGERKKGRKKREFVWKEIEAFFYYRSINKMEL